MLALGLAAGVLSLLLLYSRRASILTGRLIAIGDIHGCRNALVELLQHVAPTADDIVVTLGDYVDRGPDSAGVIEELIDLGTRTNLVPLLGNHEEMMLEVVRNNRPYHDWIRYGGLQTLESYGFDGRLDFLSPAQNGFFDTLGDYFEYDNYFFTHAAYDPSLPYEEQSTDMLRWYSLTDGIPRPHPSGSTAVVGHTANRDGEILDVGHLICIDTYCYGGGWLTAIDVHNRQLWQVNEAGQLRS